MQLEKSAIHFDDVTIHPVDSRSAVTIGQSSDDHDSPKTSELQTSVSAAKKEMAIPTIQPDTFTIHKTSEDKHGAWLTGTIEFDETFQSRSLQSRYRIGQHIENFNQKRD